MIDLDTLSVDAPVVLLVTAESLEQARAISRALLERRLVACVSLAAGLESHYWWKGVLEEACETLLIAKTLAGSVAAVRECIRQIHTYEVFELVAMPIVGGNADYLDWIRAEVKPGLL
jgi:periplasmic divalent cation tolerance protein